MRARLEDKAHKIMPNQWWKDIVPFNTISVTVSLVGKNKNGEAAKLVQDATRSKITRKTRRVLPKNIYFAMSSNRRQELFTVNIGRKRLDRRTPWRYLYSCHNTVAFNSVLSEQ
jgi:hypothetical protein